VIRVTIQVNSDDLDELRRSHTRAVLSGEVDAMAHELATHDPKPDNGVVVLSRAFSVRSLSLRVSPPEPRP